MVLKDYYSELCFNGSLQMVFWEPNKVLESIVLVLYKISTSPHTLAMTPLICNIYFYCLYYLFYFFIKYRIQSKLCNLSFGPCITQLSCWFWIYFNYKIQKAWNSCIPCFKYRISKKENRHIESSTCWKTNLFMLQVSSGSKESRL